NKEGIRYSMSQWYPKMCEYDYKGWHSNPYIGREFHGVWGDFEVNIKIDPSYTLAGTGYLQNPNEIGHGYEDEGVKVKASRKKLTWRFKAPNVHDFVWAAHTDYVHKRLKMADGPELHFFYVEDTLTENWKQLPEYTEKAFRLMNNRFGKYPYDQYSVIQGGDGGMEYPMATLITGHRSLGSLVGVTVHELIHSWFQCVLATNEALYPWVDEGFTSYATHEVMAMLFGGEITDEAHKGSYSSYFGIVRSNTQEPLTTHADHYKTNKTYGSNAYSKGTVFLHQLSYVVGQDALDRGLRRYFREWKFKHPTPDDFIRALEKESGLELDWYLEYWVNTTEVIDYGFGSVVSVDGETNVVLERIGKMPMPLVVQVKYKDGRKENYYYPMRIMRGARAEVLGAAPKQVEEWPWVEPTHVMKIPAKLSEIERIEIDPTGRMADVDRKNNLLIPDKILE
ncbi:MAG: M1 family metallopeptidase, partial [Bacteroidota bacterium]